jgi:ABC-2 type transport system permease protein
VTGLFSVEIRRFLARRAAHVLVGLALLGMLVGGVVLFVRSHPLDPARTRVLEARARAQEQEELQACASGRFGIPPDEIPPGQTLEQFCREIVQPPEIEDPGFHLTNLHDVYLGTNPLLIALFVVLGATFIGAEWHAGTVTTFLTWEPRRVRVFVTKVAVVALAGFAGLLALQGILAAILAPSALLRGTTTGANAAWLRSVTVLELRAAALAGLAGAMSAALASIGRNTAAALGVAFGYIAVAEPILRAVRPRWEPWFVFDNAATFLVGGRIGLSVHPRSTLGAAMVLAAYAAVLLAVAGLLFARRDVT